VLFKKYTPIKAAGNRVLDIRFMQNATPASSNASVAPKKEPAAIGTPATAPGKSTGSSTVLVAPGTVNFRSPPPLRQNVAVNFMAVVDAGQAAPVCLEYILRIFLC